MCFLFLFLFLWFWQDCSVQNFAADRRRLLRPIRNVNQITHTHGAVSRWLHKRLHSFHCDTFIFINIWFLLCKHTHTRTWVIHSAHHSRNELINFSRSLYWSSCWKIQFNWCIAVANDYSNVYKHNQHITCPPSINITSARKFQRNMTIATAWLVWCGVVVSFSNRFSKFLVLVRRNELTVSVVEFFATRFIFHNS